MIINFLKQKKSAAVALGLLALIFSWIEFYVIFPIIGGIRSLRFNNVYETIIMIIKIKYNSIKDNNCITANWIIAGVIVTVIVATLISAAVVVILNSLDDFLDRRRSGWPCRNFGKVWMIVVAISFLLEALVISMAVASLPALFVTSSYIKGTVGLWYCVFFDMVTVLVILSMLVYVRVTIWNGLKNVITDTRGSVTDFRFTELAIKFIVFDNSRKISFFL